MKRTTARVLTALLVAAGAGVGFVPLAVAAPAVDTRLVPAVEGWYQPNPTCATPAGCLTTDSLPVELPVPVPLDVPLSPYPAGTLHVGYAAQAETARTYLAFSFASLSGTLTGAKLEVPLDVDPANGDTLSSTAKVAVCLATGDVVEAVGSIASPPSTSCDSAVPMTYSAAPSPRLTADLAPLLVGLPTTSGLVLVPDVEKTADTDAWRVVLSAHDREGEGVTPPATLTLAVTDEQVVSTPQRPAVPLPEPAAVVPVGGLDALPFDSGSAPAPQVDVALPAVPQPAVLPEPVAAPVEVAALTTVTVGYAYPLVWLLPLALLLGVPFATRALTKDLTPV